LTRKAEVGSLRKALNCRNKFVRSRGSERGTQKKRLRGEKEALRGNLALKEREKSCIVTQKKRNHYFFAKKNGRRGGKRGEKGQHGGSQNVQICKKKPSRAGRKKTHNSLRHDWEKDFPSGGGKPSKIGLHRLITMFHCRLIFKHQRKKGPCGVGEQLTGEGKNVIEFWGNSLFAACRKTEVTSIYSEKRNKSLDLRGRKKLQSQGGRKRKGRKYLLKPRSGKREREEKLCTAKARVILRKRSKHPLKTDHREEKTRQKGASSLVREGSSKQKILYLHNIKGTFDGKSSEAWPNRKGRLGRHSR